MQTTHIHWIWRLPEQRAYGEAWFEDMMHNRTSHSPIFRRTARALRVESGAHGGTYVRYSS